MKKIKKYKLDDLPTLFRNKNYEELKSASLYILKNDETNTDAMNSLAVAYKILGIRLRPLKFSLNWLILIQK